MANVIKTKDAGAPYYQCGGTEVSLTQGGVRLDFLVLDPKHIPHLIACLQAIQVDLGQSTFPTIPFEVVDAMGRVELTQGGSSGLGWVDFCLPAGHCSTLTAGYRSTLTAGDSSTLIAGRCSNLNAGEGSYLVAKFSDGSGFRIATARVGENGIKPDTPYRVNEHGQFVET